MRGKMSLRKSIALGAIAALKETLLADPKDIWCDPEWDRDAEGPEVERLTKECFEVAEKAIRAWQGSTTHEGR